MRLMMARTSDMNSPDDRDRTPQEGIHPVQFFICPVVDPATTEPRERLGRPQRQPELDAEDANNDSGERPTER
jgi:hypothetical protein